MGHVISFANNKGGVAKTTSVCNIGFALAKMGQRVLFIDLDSQANLTSLVSPLPVEEHVNDIMDAFLRKDNLPIEAISENVDLVPSGLSLATFESRTSADSTRVFVLQDLLAGIRDNYDYILIDCPPALGTITYIALVASDYLVLVTMPESMSYSGMMMVGQLMKDVKGNPRLNPNISLLGVIVTKYRNNRVMNAYVRKIESETKKVFLNPVIHEEASVLKSVAIGQRLQDFAPNSKAAKAYEEIAKELYNRTQTV